MTIVSENVLRVECASIRFETTAGFVPLVTIKVVKVIAPVELELVMLFIVGENFDVIVHHIPRHIMGIETRMPALKCGCPEVHSQRLRLVHVVQCVMAGRCPDFVAIDDPCNVVRGPLHLVRVPVICWVKVVSVVVRFDLIMAISIDNVHCERILCDGGHNLHIKLVPLIWCEIRSIPVSKERGNSALAIWFYVKTEI